MRFFAFHPCATNEFVDHKSQKVIDKKSICAQMSDNYCGLTAKCVKR